MFEDFHAALRCMTKLKYLRLCDGCCQSMQFELDFAALSGMSQLKDLILEELCLRPHPWPSKHAWPFGLPSLQSVNIHVAEALELKGSELPSLQRLELMSADDNFQVTKPLTDVCRALPSLKTLLLHNTGICGCSGESLSHLADLKAKMQAKLPNSSLVHFEC